MNLVCSLQLSVSNCLLNCEVFSFEKYFSHACRKQNLEVILSRSRSRLDSEPGQWNGKSTWPFYRARVMKQVAPKGRLRQRTLQQGPGDGCLRGHAQECHLWNKSEQLWDSSVVCAAESRMPWQGAALPSPPWARVSSYVVHSLDENHCLGVVCAADVSGGRQRLHFSPD